MKTAAYRYRHSPHLLALASVLAMLSDCRGDDERRRQTLAAERATELLRITDPAHGAEQLRSRILQNLKVSGPFVAVRIYHSDVQVIPSSTPWTVRCDEISGIAIAFTPNVTDTAGGLAMLLSESRPYQEQRLDIALSTAKVLDAILAGR